MHDVYVQECQYLWEPRPCSIETIDTLFAAAAAAAAASAAASFT